jgi:hypothetical protein
LPEAYVKANENFNFDTLLNFEYLWQMSQRSMLLRQDMYLFHKEELKVIVEVKGSQWLFGQSSFYRRENVAQEAKWLAWNNKTYYQKFDSHLKPPKHLI